MQDRIYFCGDAWTTDAAAAAAAAAAAGATSTVQIPTGVLPHVLLTEDVINNVSR